MNQRKMQTQHLASTYDYSSLCAVSSLYSQGKLDQNLKSFWWIKGIASEEYKKRGTVHVVLYRILHYDFNRLLQYVCFRYMCLTMILLIIHAEFLLIEQCHQLTMERDVSSV